MGYTPPEGGWGWAVVIGAFISIGFSYAFPKSITVFFKEIEVIFNASSSKVSWISSIMLAVMYAGGKWAAGSSACACVSVWDAALLEPKISKLASKLGVSPYTRAKLFLFVSLLKKFCLMPRIQKPG